MNLPDKLLVILVMFAAASPLGAGTVAAHSAPAPGAVLYAPEAAKFRALIVDSRLARAAGMGAEPVCVPAPVLAPAGVPAAGGEPPAGPIQRVLAGPVAAAHAGGLGREASAARDPLPGLPAMPAPEGWKLFLCGLGILAFIAVRRARGIG